MKFDGSASEEEEEDVFKLILTVGNNSANAVMQLQAIKE
jgi:hypothetical protein